MNKKYKDFESTIAEAMYIPFINKKAMALLADVERKARVITYQVFKRRYGRKNGNGSYQERKN